MTFGEVVAYCLEQRGMSQAELARRIGTGRQTINSIIKGCGKRGPTIDTAIAISRELHVPLSEMARMMEEGVPCRS